MVTILMSYIKITNYCLKGKKLKLSDNEIKEDLQLMKGEAASPSDSGRPSRVREESVTSIKVKDEKIQNCSSRTTRNRKILTIN